MKITQLQYGLAFFVLFSLSPLAFGAGFALYEGSARGNVLGGLTGHGDDAAAVYYNPAGITNLEGVHFMAGATFIGPKGDFSLTNAYDGAVSEAEYEDNIFTPPHIYYTRPLNEKFFLGLGVFSRFGLGTEFDPDWAGRYSNIETVIQTASINANLAYKVNDKFSVALGINAMWADVVLKSAIDATTFLGEPPNNPNTNALDAIQEITGDTIAVGFNAAIFIQPTENFSFGVHYMQGIEQELDDASAEFTRPEAPVPDTWFVDSEVAVSLELPDKVFLGFNSRPTDRLSVGGGLVWTAWSSVDVLNFEYAAPIVVIPGLDLAVDTVDRELLWEDVWRYSLGFEYKVNEQIDAQLGFVFDESPVPDETISFLLPTNDRRLVNIGLRYRAGDWVFDASYNHLILEDRDMESNGRQFTEGVLDAEVRDAWAYLVGLSASRRF